MLPIRPSGKVDEFGEHHARRVGLLGAQMREHGFVHSRISVTEAAQKLRAGGAGDGMDLDTVFEHAGEDGKRVGQRQGCACRKSRDGICVEFDAVCAPVAGAHHQIGQDCVPRAEGRIPLHSTCLLYTSDAADE